MISSRRKCKEIERKSFGAKTGQKQGKNKGLQDFVASAKLALRYKTASQPKRSRCGINVPLRKQSSFAKPISQLNWLFCENFHREGPEAAKWFRSKVPISQRLRNLADPYFCPIFALFLLRFRSERLSSISLQFLLILIIQKPILHQNKLELKHLKSKLTHWNQN